MKQFEIGKSYRINHSRKGVFSIRVTGMNDEFVQAIIADGTSRNLSREDNGPGEPITFRKSLAEILDTISDLHAETKTGA